MPRFFLIRLSIFIILFLLISTVFGPGIVESRLLYPFYFFVYGNLGKVLLFSIIAFYILAGVNFYKKLDGKYDNRNLLFLLPAGLLLITFSEVKNRLLAYNDFWGNPGLSILAHSYVLLIPVMLALGIFGYGFWKSFFKKFRKEITLSSLLSILSYFLIFYIWNYWIYLSDLVLVTVKLLFSLTHKNIIYFPPRTLFVENFAVTINEACSGLESLLLFTGLSLLIGFTDRGKLDMKKFIVFYIVGLTGTFLLNIFRVYMIILSGLLFSPVIASKLFHTYLGMVLFLGYFMLFLKLNYKKIVRKPVNNAGKHS